MVGTWTGSFALVALFLCSLTSGYILDDSCDGQNNRLSADEVVRAMRSVHHIARSASATFQELSRNRGRRRDAAGEVREEAFMNFIGNLGDEDGLPDPELVDWDRALTVITWIIQQTTDGGTPGNPETPPHPRRKDRENPKMRRIKYGGLDHRDVVVYCHMERFDTRGQYAVDRETGYETRETEASLRAKLRPYTQGEEFSVAYTWNPKLRGRRTPWTYPSVIQLNPDVQTYLRALGRVDRNMGNMREFYPTGRKNSFMYTLDFYLFHELAHTHHDPDIVIGDDGGYLWDSCLRNSRRVGWRNAESLTIFAWLTVLSRPPFSLDYERDGIPKAIDLS